MDNQLHPNWNSDMGATPVYEIPAGAAASVVAFDGGVSSNGLGFAINSDDEEVLDLTMDNQPEPNWNSNMGETPLYEVPAAAAASVAALDGDVYDNGGGSHCAHFAAQQPSSIPPH
jgi:hypothetical protein